MIGRQNQNPQLNMFEVALVNLIDMNHELVILSKRIDWTGIENDFKIYYTDFGRPSIPIRKMVSCILLKQLYNLSDENFVERWKENPYWQYFSGEVNFQKSKPFEPSEFSHFRKRTGKEGAEKILQYSIKLFEKEVDVKEVKIDSTVQEKNITYPVDVKQYRKIINKCREIAKKESLRLRQSYIRTVKKLSLDIRFSAHPKRKKKAYAANRKLKTIAGRLVRELKRLLSEKENFNYEDKLSLFHKVIHQKRDDKNKIYSLHEPEVQCIAKGKEHKPYEFGNKSSIALTDNGIIVGAYAFEKNLYDGDTLAIQLEQIERLTGSRPEKAVTDRGYRGRKYVNQTEILIPGQQKPKNQYQKNIIKKRFRRRAAIEPVIGHLKHDHRMLRNYLKGTAGDFINTVLAAAAFNIKRLLNRLKHRFRKMKDYLYLLINCFFYNLFSVSLIYSFNFEYEKNRLFKGRLFKNIELKMEELK